ncbi:hypothetical protein EV356DRAFT_536678 [Viridothelium virens]|uniref:Hemerythrin-like domain-containing protein n=1 Tax=Viridothelium virens TaxID=1048519 RepID=A0A6A6GXB4_VIRVR|nr:hypothetical protein EV356DRAFT_536678 [Viridothelium virens]
MTEVASPITTPNGAVEEAEKEEAEKPLPALTPGEFRVYNRMAEHMELYHNNFRHTWTTLHTACTSRQRPAGMSLPQFVSLGLSFAHHLTFHHTIEEEHIFPVLAARMPAFQAELELLSQHRQIHEGLEAFETYLEACRAGERELRWEELRGLMDGFGGVLWAHLDEEVRELGAEKMRRYWSLREMKGLPM